MSKKQAQAKVAPAAPKKAKTKDTVTPKGAFERCRIRLQLRGQHYYTNFINNITPPEYLILQNLHSPTAVTFLEKQGVAMLSRLTEDGKRQERPLRSAELMEKLTLKYGEIRFKEVFPGAQPILPLTFDAIGAGVRTEEGEEFEDEQWQDSGEESGNDKTPNESAGDLLGDENTDNEAGGLLGSSDAG